MFWALELSVGGGFNFRRVLVVVLSTDGVSGAMVLASKGSTVIPLLGNGDFAATISSAPCNVLLPLDLLGLTKS